MFYYKPIQLVVFQPESKTWYYKAIYLTVIMYVCRLLNYFIGDSNINKII